MKLGEGEVESPRKGILENGGLFSKIGRILAPQNLMRTILLIRQNVRDIGYDVYHG